MRAGALPSFTTAQLNGVFDDLDFVVEGIPHRMVIDGGRFDRQRVVTDLAPICEERASMFGDLPVSDYLFMTLATAVAAVSSTWTTPA